jgi:hypothetical protein
VTQPVERVECERSGQDRLFDDLDPLRQAGSKLDNVRAAESGRGDEICEGETIEHWRAWSAGGTCTTPVGKESGRTDGEPNTGDAVSNGAEPGELWLVDGEVWAGRACETLGVQDHRAILWFERLCLDSAENVC